MIRDWLQQPLVLADALPYALMAAAFLLLLVGLARANYRSRHAAQTGTSPNGKGILSRLFSTTDLTPTEDILLRLVALAFLCLFALALAATFVLVGSIVVSVTGTEAESAPQASFGLGALLVALLGAPFLVWRTLVAQRTLEATQRQTELQDEALFNDKINAAATDLAARRQVTRSIMGGEEGERILTEWADDLVTRAAAIDRLEGLALEAMDRSDFAPAQRIARMLSIYVQELSREYPAKAPPEAQNRDIVLHWAETLRPVVRPDMERAAQSLGRINPTDDARRAKFNPKNIDLRDCNLQGFDLDRLNYQDCLMKRADFSGAFLEETKLQRADLVETVWWGTYAAGAELNEANMHLAMGRYTNFVEAKMQGASFWEARLPGADLRYALMQNANFIHAQMPSANLRHAQLQGANLSFSRLQGADLRFVTLSEESNLTSTFLILKAAAVAAVDNTTIAKLAPFWDYIFADGTVLPDRPDRPKHWSTDELASGSLATDPDSPFHQAWRAWAAEHHPDVPLAID